MRLLNLARRLHDEAGDTPVGAITLPPRMLERRPTVWPGFPWSSLTGLVDTFVPMASTGSAFLRRPRPPTGTPPLRLASLRSAIDEAGAEPLIDAAGGVADRMSADELEGFVDAAADAGVAGISLYDVHPTRPRGWAALAGFAGSASENPA